MERMDLIIHQNSLAFFQGQVIRFFSQKGVLLGQAGEEEKYSALDQQNVNKRGHKVSSRVRWPAF